MNFPRGTIQLKSATLKTTLRPTSLLKSFLTFICGSFNDAVNSSDCIMSNDSAIDNELERM
jgi:hypothetical protein